ncbi:MAG: protein kinase [Paracoccaceae bacterium]
MAEESAPPPPPASPPPPQTTLAVTTGTRIIGTYEIESLINSGGMGEVYRGRNIHNGEPVAIKIVLATLAHDPKIVALFQKEATVLGRLAHEAIVRYHVFTNDPAIGRPCMVMEFVEGTAMSDRIEQGPMPLEEVKILFRRVASGLDKAHRAGVVHRDLSPDNVILEGGLVEHAKLIDFGIAKSSSIGGGTLLQGQFAGKFNWVSPEQLGAFGGVIDGRSDIYSLALLIAAASRGKVVDMGASIVDAVGRRASVPALDGADPVLVPLLTWMLQPDPALRPDSMAVVIAALDNPALVPLAEPAPAPGYDEGGNRTVIGGSLPPASVPPTRAAAASVPPVSAVPVSAVPVAQPSVAPMRSLPPAADPAQTTGGGWDAPRRQPTSSPATVIAAQPGVSASAPPGPGVDVPMAADPDDSPFGLPGTPVPTADSLRSPPAEAKGGKGGILALLGLLIVLGGGAGLWFSGLLGDQTPPAADRVAAGENAPPAAPADPPSETKPVVEPQSPAPPPAAEVKPEASAAEPATEPAAAAPEPAVQQPAATAPESKPEVVPAPDAKAIAEKQLAWLKTYKQPDCVLIRAVQAGDAVQMEGLAVSPAPLDEAADAMEKASGARPAMTPRLVNDTQCPVLDFVHRHASETPVAITLSQGGAVVKSGSTVSGTVEGLGRRSAVLFLVSEAGGATNLKQWTALSSDGTVSFSFTVSLAPGAPPAPQLLLAVVTDKPLTNLDAVPNGVTVRSLMPYVDVQLAGEKQTGATGLAHFLLEN